MTQSRYSVGFSRLKNVVAQICFFISMTAIIYRFFYLGDYYPIDRWPNVPFYSDDMVLLVLSVAIGISTFRRICTFPIGAIEYVLGGFLGYEEDVLSPGARILLNFYDHGTTWIMLVTSYATWALFLLIVWTYADQDAVRNFATAVPLFGSESVTGYVMGLLLFVSLRLLSFTIQSIVLVGAEQWLHQRMGENVMDEVRLHLERHAAARGYLPLMERLLAYFGSRDPGTASRGRGIRLIKGVSFDRDRSSC
jgi:hypothetical protein